MKNVVHNQNTMKARLVRSGLAAAVVVGLIAAVPLLSHAGDAYASAASTANLYLNQNGMPANVGGVGSDGLSPASDPPPNGDESDDDEGNDHSWTGAAGAIGGAEAIIEAGQDAGDGSVGKGSGNGIGDGADNGTDNGAGNGSGNGNDETGGTGGNGADGSDGGGGFFGSIADLGKSAYEGAKDKIAEGYNSTKDALGDGFERVSTGLNAVKTKGEGIAHKVWGSVKSRAKTAWEKTKHGFEVAWNQGKGLFKAMYKGLADGVNSIIMNCLDARFASFGSCMSTLGTVLIGMAGVVITVALAPFVGAGATITGLVTGLIGGSIYLYQNLGNDEVDVNDSVLDTTRLLASLIGLKGIKSTTVPAIAKESRKIKKGVRLINNGINLVRKSKRLKMALKAGKPLINPMKEVVLRVAGGIASAWGGEASISNLIKSMSGDEDKDNQDGQEKNGSSNKVPVAPPNALPKMGEALGTP